MEAPFNSERRPEDATALVQELANQQRRGRLFELESFPAGQKILNADPQTQRRAVLSLIRWLQEHGPTVLDVSSIRMREALLTLLKRKLPLDEADVLALLDWSIRARHNYWRGLPHIVRAVGEYLKGHDLSSALQAKLQELVLTLEAGQTSVDIQRQIARLNELAGRDEIRLPLEAGDPWAEAAVADIEAQEDEAQHAWARLLLHCLRASGSAPSNKWTADGEAAMKAVGEERFRVAVLRWFPLADKPRETADRNSAGQIPLPLNADLLKGLAWLCSTLADAEIARALAALSLSAYRRLPGSGPRAVKIGNACFWALGSMRSPEALAQLSIVKAKIKGSAAQKAIAAALELAAERSGVSVDEAEELGVPTYGLEATGTRTYTVGDVLAEIHIVGTSVEQTWERSGERLAGVPGELKSQHAAEVKQIEQTAREMRKILLAQRERIEGLYLSPRKWSLEAWRARYIEHPLVGSIARRLIWKFSNRDRAESAIWHDGHIIRRDGAELAWLDEAATVELWHPMSADAAVVMQWREWLAAHEVQQPFKQAHREIYPLTDAERATRVYTNRYAAHILRQHQFHALCGQRGWKDSLRLMVNAELPPATRSLPHWGLRAEFWVEGLGDRFENDTNTTGTFLYLTTDQVRFYRREAMQNRAHTRGGGYHAPRPAREQDAEPLPLDSIPPIVFSEIMRDVDLFVGVASVGNDPSWLDSGANVRYRDYWHGFSFGELTESAKTRKEVLAALIPRLKIAGRCQIVDKFLRVSGELRTYRIHLGSGNILMEPNDQYLCIVPSRGSAQAGKERLFLPFEGDQTLAIILSKAFMLADDKKITDPTIILQVRT